MPACRIIRRSRRLSKQPPRDPNTDEYDLYDLNLMYPEDSDSSPSPPAPAPNAVLPAPDLTGEPEVEPESPPFLPTCVVAVTTRRSSHSRKRDPDYIPRPPNAFMIFRSDLWAGQKIKKSVERDHRQISRIAGQLWNKMTQTQRAPFLVKADEAKRQHALTYPNYKYAPVYRKDKGSKRKAKPNQSEQIHRSQRLATLMHRGIVGDALERAVLRREKSSEDVTYSSDESEYVEGPRRKKARKCSSKKSTAPPRSLRSLHPEAEIQHEGAEPSAVVEPVIKLESPTVAAQLVCFTPSPILEDCSEGFVPTEDIPSLSLGEPAVCDGVHFTDPFSPWAHTGHGGMSHGKIGPLSPISSCSLPADFLGMYGEAPALDLGSPSEELPCMPIPFDVYSPESYLSSNDLLSPYDARDAYADAEFLDTDFSEWMNCED